MSRLTDHAGSGLSLTAPAKVNLFLEVLGRRPDGFHTLETLMVAVDLCDTLDLMPANALTLSCSDASLETGSGNLVLQAAARLRAASGCSAGATIHLTKNIPMAAGLGGGSSDAAATLRGLNQLWNLNWDQQRLAAIAAEVGSDVAFFLDGPAAWCTGRGEIIEPIPLGSELHLVLVCPPFGMSTAAVYNRLRLPAAPRSGMALRAAAEDGDVTALGRELFNRLQEPAEELNPQVRTWREFLAALRPSGCLMSGSGSTLFALCPDRVAATRLAGAVADRAPPGPPPRVFVVRSVAPG